MRQLYVHKDELGTTRLEAFGRRHLRDRRDLARAGDPRVVTLCLAAFYVPSAALWER
jgi:hypothetical protein